MPVTAHASAPTRVDLAGGTLDLWPLCHLLEAPALTVNVALALRAEATVTARDDGIVEIRSVDLGQIVQCDVDRLKHDRLGLATRLVEALAPNRSLTVTLRSGVPRQSGLGGSSALSVALGAALLRFCGREVDAEHYLRFIQNFETRLLGLPTGYQDYYPPLFGGAMALEATFDGVVRHALDGGPAFLREHLLLADTRLDHESGMNNWEVLRGFLDGEFEVRASLNRINQCAYRMRDAVEACDLPAAARALDDEWTARRTLAPIVSNERIDALIAAAKAAGALAGKVCGAGGGGCIVFFVPPGTRADVTAAIEAEEGAVLEFEPALEGLSVQDG